MTSREPQVRLQHRPTQAVAPERYGLVSRRRHPRPAVVRRAPRGGRPAQPALSSKICIDAYAPARPPQCEKRSSLAEEIDTSSWAKILVTTGTDMTRSRSGSHRRGVSGASTIGSSRGASPCESVSSGVAPESRALTVCLDYLDRGRRGPHQDTRRCGISPFAGRPAGGRSRFRPRREHGGRRSAMRRGRGSGGAGQAAS